MKRSEPMRRTPLNRSGPPPRKRAMPRGKPKARSARPEYGQAFWQTQREALYARAGGRCELARESLEAARGIDLALKPYPCRCGCWHLGHSSLHQLEKALASGRAATRATRRRRKR